MDNSKKLQEELRVLWAARFLHTKYTFLWASLEIEVEVQINVSLQLHVKVHFYIQA